MIEILIVVVTAIVLTALSHRANRRLRPHARLPMQGSLTGRVNWTAPRAVALGFMPVLGTAVLSATAASLLLLTPRPGQEGLGLPALLLTAGVLVAVHLLHLTLLDRSLRADKG